LTFWSNIVLQYLVIFIGASFIVLSCVSLLSHYDFKRRNPGVNKMFPIESFISLLFGILLMIFPVFFMKILMILLGVALFIGGASQIYAMIQINRAGGAIKGVVYLIPSLILLAGIVIIINPFTFAEAILILIFGITTLVYGVTNLIRYFLKK
ncbi:MAG: DUF308 domain-containing protein, partial [Rikenellaceae bacterium]